MKHGSTSSPAISPRVRIADKQRRTRGRSVAQQANTMSHQGPSRHPSADRSSQRPAKRPRTEADSAEDDASSADEVTKTKKKKKEEDEDEKVKIKRNKNKAYQQKKRRRQNEFVVLSKRIRTNYEFTAPVVLTGDRQEWRAQVEFPMSSETWTTDRLVKRSCPPVSRAKPPTPPPTTSRVPRSNGFSIQVGICYPTTAA